MKCCAGVVNFCLSCGAIASAASVGELMAPRGLGAIKGIGGNTYIYIYTCICICI